MLEAFGRSYGALLQDGSPLKDGEELFLDEAVSALSEEEKVVCVRLALFAEMVKGKPWTPTTLKEVGGTEGVGVTFLEETFSSRAANPRHRLHQRAAQGVLKVLLPDTGSDIKGTMRSAKELRPASGYETRAKDFDDLLHILDAELRLITPTDPAGAASDGETDAAEKSATDQFYQLTHDYLVPALREWLTRKQKETRRGRAELRFAERASLWNAKPENRHLPSLWEFLNIRLLTNRWDWSQRQKKMMQRAGRLHGMRSALAVAVVLVISIAIYEIQGRVRAASRVGELLAAETSEVPARIESLAGLDRWTHPLLQKAAEQDGDTTEQQKQRLHARLALVEEQPVHAASLLDDLLSAPPGAVQVICEQLSPSDKQVTRLWSHASSEEKPRTSLNAACALARYDSDNEKGWRTIRASAAEQLVRELTRNPRDYQTLTKLMEPVRVTLAGPLAQLTRDKALTPSQRETAFNVLLEYGHDQVTPLCDVLLDAEPLAFEQVLSVIEPQADAAARVLEAEIAKPLEECDSEEAKEYLAKRQANGAIALLRLGKPAAAWTVFQHCPDPRARSYLIHRAAPWGVKPAAIIAKAKEPTTEVSTRRALLLCLGEFNQQQLPPNDRDDLVPRLLELYRTHPDAGLHAASQWLLSQWDQQEAIVETRQWLGWEQNTEGDSDTGNQDDQRQWYVSSEGHTMAVLPSGSFKMGSPESDPDREPRELLHTKRIGRRFALSAGAVTREQYVRFVQDRPDDAFDTRKLKEIEAVVKTDDSPNTGVNWYDAVAYCNWLSEQEGIPEDQWCYQRNSDGKFAAGMQPKPEYLSLRGYRLPSESEWEYACRAGAVTRRYYGHSAELLGQYAWYLDNTEDRTWPAGVKKPNDFGLFDMHGNVWAWCHNPLSAYDGKEKDVEDLTALQDTQRRVMRGGSIYYPARHVRSASDNSFPPFSRLTVVGFRVARTYP